VYRIRAFNANGYSGYSNTAAATTPAQLEPPGGPNALEVYAISSSAVKLQWVNSDTSADGIRIERCVSASCPNNLNVVSTVSGTATAYVDSGLTPLAYHMYRLRAFNAAGTSATSNTVVIVIPPPASYAPSNLTATAVSTSQVDLAWTHNAVGADGYIIERCLGFGCFDYGDYFIQGNLSTAFQDKGLPPSSTYSYRVRAFYYGTSSARSNASSATTAGVPIAPAAPTALVATVVSSGEITLSWTDNSDNETGFRLERCAGSTCTNFSDGVTLAANGTNWTQQGLSGSTTYRFRVQAFNTAGNSSYSNVTAATTPLPPQVVPLAPSNLEALVLSSEEIRLQWTDNADNESGFRLERCQGAACTAFVEVEVPAANATSTIQSGLQASTTYRFRLRAYNSTGSSAYSNIVSGTTTAAPLAAPVAPSNLTASAVSASEIGLAWSDNADNEAGFRLESCMGAGCTAFADAGILAASVTTTVQQGLTAATTYRFRMRAYNAAGYSAYSNIAAATTASEAPATPASLGANHSAQSSGGAARYTSTVQLSWQNIAANFTSTQVERCSGSGCANFAIVATVNAPASAYADGPLVTTTTYRYRIRAFNGTTASGYSGVLSVMMVFTGSPQYGATRYGNWCGAGWNGGQEGLAFGSGAAVDDLDGACRIHDWAYRSADATWRPVRDAAPVGSAARAQACESWRAAFRTADEQLYGRAFNLPIGPTGNPDSWNYDSRIFGQHPWSSVKRDLWVSYLITVFYTGLNFLKVNHC
jgi:predicted phage tail protein